MGPADDVSKKPLDRRHVHTSRFATAPTSASAARLAGWDDPRDELAVWAASAGYCRGTLQQEA